jgi:catechol 2,3-dioxygenase-like lactoylglutathione lyase family enzyme
VGADDFGFNHVGLCVRDLDASRRFYESVLGFSFLRSLDVPDGPTGQLLALPPPLGLSAVYLQRDGFVLELLSYSARGVVIPARERTMDEVGLTHISLSVARDRLASVLDAVVSHGGSVADDMVIEGVAVFIRDPDGQLIELLAR